MHLIVGGGYLGMRVACRWRDQGHPVAVVTRSAQRANELSAQGFHAVVADVTEAQTLSKSLAADSILFAVGYDRASGNTIEDVYAGGLRNVLDAASAHAKRLIYISTTGVYGPAGGDWVDEDTPPDPRRDGGRASLAAENILASHPIGKRSIILRLAGIYGPGRIPFLKELRAGAPIAAPRDGYLNLIHVDDAAQIVVVANSWLGNRPAETGPHIFCASDGAPVARGDYYREVARLIGAPAPTFINPEPGSAKAARAEANRRIRNEHMVRELDVRLAYPSYREGLASILESENRKA